MYIKKEFEAVSNDTRGRGNVAPEWGKERKGECRGERENQRGDVVRDKLRMWHACGEEEQI